ncbi:GNAT family N-acetyltransferase [Streptomyces sp. NRRL WC-3549]|uniref:GNAT family N-acetyltransferase n=1 Tax=Streptomyces sp. NRRL WC-3549 TaxID=1463925 RepID=UPI0004C8CAD9|nr:GNAT family N-acetyltransferase [Streptomyces sp. NRRL WC-3549]
MDWTVSPEPFDSPDAALLRRDYYDEVASRYWGRPATAEEIDDGLTGDGAERLTPPTGQFRSTGGGGLLLAAVEREARALGVTRIRLDTRHDLVEARALYARHGYAEVPAFNQGPYAEHWFAKEL